MIGAVSDDGDHRGGGGFAPEVVDHDVDIGGGPAESAGDDISVPFEQHGAGGGQARQPAGAAPGGDDLAATGSLFRVLAILRDRRLRMTALADYLGLEKSTVSGLVDRAEKRGLLERAPSTSDGRAVDVFLSPAGAELAGRLYVQVRTSLSPMLNKLAPAEQHRLQTLLERMLGPRES